MRYGIDKHPFVYLISGSKGSRGFFEKFNKPAGKGKNKKDPKGGENSDNKIKRQVSNICRCPFCQKSVAYDKQGSKEGQGVKKASQKTNRKLNFKIIKFIGAYHVFSKGSVYPKPVANKIYNKKKQKKFEKERARVALMVFIVFE